MLFSLTQSSLVVSSLFFSLISASTVPAPSAPVTVNIDGSSYVWKGTVAYGTLDGNLVDEFGDSLGGIGSAIGQYTFLGADLGVVIAELFFSRYRCKALQAECGRHVLRPHSGPT